MPANPPYSLKHGDALIVVDVQNDFLPGGRLAVTQGDAVVPILNTYIAAFAQHGLPIYATRDWHPAQHCSFKDQGGPWPPHCVADTHGARFAADLKLPPASTIVSKATASDQDAYSGFEGTHLDAQLHAADVQRLFIGGLTTDYCVLHTVKDALARHYDRLQGGTQRVGRSFGKLLVDFGLRRAHGAEAGLLAARAGYLAGMSGTSTVLAGAAFGIPVFGTMAHSFIEAHDSEADAFEHFARSLPSSVVLLIDTYDTEIAAGKVVQLAQRLKAAGIHIKGVRLDSGDLAQHAQRVRRILDAGGMTDATIFASGNLDEIILRDLLAQGAPIDGFGVGTHLDTSSDAPYLDCAYKLQEYAGKARRKRSEGKATWPGRKQVYRRTDAKGGLLGDTLTLAGDTQEGMPLLVPVMRDGARLAPSPPLMAVRGHVAQQLACLPAAMRGLEAAPEYPVSVARALRDLATAVDQQSV